jgi:flagellar hook-length control protein FliK
MTTPGSNAASPTTAAPALGPATAVAGTQSGDGAGSRLRVEQPGELRAGTRLTRGTGPRLRTYDAQAMELQLKTRDSVFKNIAMRLLPDGGEMRMRLDPPHLGNLDIKLVVEKGVVVQLSLGAERADVANMLDRSLPELKQFLESQGLSLGHSAVSTFEFAGQSHAHHSWGNGGNGSGAEDHEPEALTGALRSDFVTAEGLDFWA